MVAIAYSVAFEGIEARLVEVQCSASPGLPGFAIVGLPDKTVSEARERVRAAFGALSIAMPNKKLTVNLSPADLPKEGSHFDLPIALAVLAALDIIPHEELSRCVCMGELALDGRLVGVAGALPAAMAAAEEERALICPASAGPEAAWVRSVPVIAAGSLRTVVDHLTERKPIAPAAPGVISRDAPAGCLSDIKGQERAKRALEIAAAGRHHLLMVGPPGAGKSMLASRLVGLMPPLTPAEALETSMIHSLAGTLRDGGISRHAPYCDPHHSASMAAIVGGGRSAQPGQISLAHNGVLFMDELPEFSRQVLETLRQPIETGEVVIARANRHVRYPCRFLLVAAANPCRCGHLADASRACARAPGCGEDYLGKISGPLMDRFDIRLEVPAVSFLELELPAGGEPSTAVAARVTAAREIQRARFRDLPRLRANADASGAILDEIAAPDSAGRALILKASEKLGLTARGYHRILRTARTIADLEGSDKVLGPHLAEAISYRLPFVSGG
ncbi:YifB family Mg chelatase-like AAA ATPase [Paracoccus seriniphilus]|uniref:Magnesium chelatase family protein n=1 Tax=Paracoccus seriniphilus TaxID=184748 RepID=A0A239PWG2_9RHOB|nr:YifB family Mg chelatase-like AAA ATPase [Paracoccus seriniphilus]WCR13400.1 YifB family Mg chelatase-like AAA ATPase [Paracoccus seriniphilus]SNT74353.1 magnesium chelatase family protein [Paracoccus seriniphilus]